jgi:hypothetical protein
MPRSRSNESPSGKTGPVHPVADAIGARASTVEASARSCAAARSVRTTAECRHASIEPLPCRCASRQSHASINEPRTPAPSSRRVGRARWRER